MMISNALYIWLSPLRRAFPGRGWIVGMLLFYLSLTAWGQQWPAVPDSVSLIDPRWYDHPELGRRILKLEKIPAEGSLRLAGYREVYESGMAVQDANAMAFAAVSIANCHLANKELDSAWHWVQVAISTDSLLNPLSPLRQAVQSRLGGIYFQFQAFRLAKPFLREGFRIDCLRDTIPTSRRYRFCSSYAICLDRAGERDSALFYYQLAIQIGEDLRDDYWKAAGLNNLGHSFLLHGNLDSAFHYFTLADSTLIKDTPAAEAFSVSILDNLGQTYAKMGKYGPASEIFSQLAMAAEARKDWKRAVSSRIQAGEAFWGMGALGEAKEHLKFAEQAVVFLTGAEQEAFGIQILRLKIRLAEAAGDFALQARLQGEAIALGDSMLAEAVEGKLGSLEKMLIEKSTAYRSQMNASQFREAELRASRRFLLAVLLGAAAVAILGLAVLVLMSRRRILQAQSKVIQMKLQREKMELQLENESLMREKLGQELVLKQRDLTDFALAISQRRKVTEEILQNLRRIRQSSQPMQEIQELILVLNAQLGGEERVALAAEHPDKVNRDYFEKLKQLYPDLSPAELEMCGLIRLKFSNKDIAALRNIEPGSVRIARFRLKKKLALKEGEDLQDFLWGL